MSTGRLVVIVFLLAVQPLAKSMALARRVASVRLHKSVGGNPGLGRQPIDRGRRSADVVARFAR